MAVPNKSDFNMICNFNTSLTQDKATLLETIRHHGVEGQVFENIHTSLEVLYFILMLLHAAIYMRGPPVKCKVS